MDFNKDKAIFLQIAEMLFESILADKWPESERMPSIREMAVSMEVNPNTAIRTFNYLQEKDVIYNKRGIGYFVSDDGYKKTLKLKKEEFVNSDLPLLFKSMKMLNISFDELKKYYSEYK